MMKVVNLNTYPINDDKSSNYQSIIQSSISQLDSQGFVKLHNFLQPEIVDELTVVVVCDRCKQPWLEHD